MALRKIDLPRQLGFTLIEIAIVLVVIGLLVSGGLVAISPVLQSAKISESKSKIARVESALLAYVIANGCLPCPASTARPSSTDAAAGQSEVGGAGNTAPCAGACTFTVGIVPWENLGLAEGDVTDGFNNLLTYAATSALSDSATDMTRSGSTYPAGALTVTDALGNLTTAAAYVIVGHGVDGSFAFAPFTGAQRADQQGGASANQTQNGDFADGTFALVAPNPNTGANYFDDIVVFKTAPNMIQACGAGSCGNPA
ncbi:MAG: prepilin-type N-terminal cleavage/methylation domain-containing protein [Rhodobacteraceae bacterium]|nr:prepilin-type N-terminal cleavage/methylation domain-containing protein [Paracoccaceae bacterium]